MLSGLAGFFAADYVATTTRVVVPAHTWITNKLSLSALYVHSEMRGFQENLLLYLKGIVASSS